MVSEAKCQSVKIILAMLILVGAFLSGNCQAERNPTMLSNESFHRDLIGPESTRQLAEIKEDYQQNKKRWSEFKLFASEQASSAKQMLASLELENWWQELGARDVSPAVQQRPADGAAGAISPTAIAVNLAAGMSTIQLWQASNLAAGLVDSGQRRIAQVANNLETELQASLNQLVELASSSRFGPRVNGLIQAMAFGQSSNLSSGESPAAESSRAELLTTSKIADEGSPADPYWQYYSDCDFWGAKFEATNE